MIAVALGRKMRGCVLFEIAQEGVAGKPGQDFRGRNNASALGAPARSKMGPAPAVSRTAAGSARPRTEIATEQQMSAKRKPGWMASFLATTPPAGIVPKRRPPDMRRASWSWLNRTESQLAVLSAQCLGQRIPDRPTLEGEVPAWLKRRNASRAKGDWRFTTAEACIKLKNLYPSL